MPDPSRLIRRLPGGQRGVDVLVALLATAVIAVVIASAPELDARDPDGWAYLFAAALGGLPALMRLLGKRAWWLPRAIDRRLPHVEVERPS